MSGVFRNIDPPPDTALYYIYVSTLCFIFCYTLIKKKTIFYSYIRKSRRERLQSHIWLTVSSYMNKYLRISSYTVLGGPSSYMFCNRSHRNFLIYKENFILFFISALYVLSEYRLEKYIFHSNVLDLKLSVVVSLWFKMWNDYTKRASLVQPYF
jgi:hypothetical protein